MAPLSHPVQREDSSILAPQPFAAALRSSMNMVFKQALWSLGLFGRRTRREPDDSWPDEHPIPLTHPLVPEDIRRAVEAFSAPFAHLHRVQTDDGIEWWLMDDDGNLLESFRLAGGQ